MAFLGGGRVQLVYDAQMDLSAYRRRDASGKLTPQLDVPGLIIWFNHFQFSDYQAFLRDPNFPNLLYIELMGNKNDHISLEIIEVNNHRCSQEIILPAESAYFTPTRPVENTSTRISPTVISSSTATRTLAPTYAQTPISTATHTLTPTPTNSNTPTPANTNTSTSIPTNTNTPRTPEPLPSASLTPTPTR